MELVPPAVEVQSPNHWTARELPRADVLHVSKQGQRGEAHSHMADEVQAILPSCLSKSKMGHGIGSVYEGLRAPKSLMNSASCRPAGEDSRRHRSPEGGMSVAGLECLAWVTQAPGCQLRGRKRGKELRPKATGAA